MVEVHACTKTRHAPKFSFIQHQLVNQKLEDGPSPIMTPTPLGDGTGDDVPVVHDAAPPNHDPHLAIPSLHVTRAPRYPAYPIHMPQSLDCGDDGWYDA